MKIIIVILFTFISTYSISAKQNQDPSGTYIYTIDEVYNELDIAEMDSDSLSLSEIVTEVQAKKIFSNVEIDIQIVQLWKGKFHKVNGKKFDINEFDEQDMFVRVKVK